MNKPEISEDKFFKSYFWGIHGPDIEEIKSDLKEIKEIISKLSTKSTPEGLLTVGDLAKQIKYSKRTIYKLIEDGKINPVRLLNQDLRFKQEDVDQMIETHKLKS